MKARLLQHDGLMQLLVCTGSIQDVTAAEACAFLMNYDNQNYYSGDGKWNYEGLTMESFRGETIAIVNDDNSLTIMNAEWFRKLLEENNIEYVTAPEYAELHKKKPAIIRRFCLNQRIPGAVLKGNTWLIPKNAPYPDDDRVRLK